MGVPRWLSRWRAKSPHCPGDPPSPTDTVEGRTSPTKNPRYFRAAEKKDCWENAKTMPGRDPDRWRIDPAGNPICKELWGVAGLHGFEYDHIVPYAKGGPSTRDNCQVLQTKVNRTKNKHDLDTEDMEMASLFMRFTDEELDLVEMPVYGDVNRPKRKCKLITKAASMICLNPPEMICGKMQSEDCMSAPRSPQSKQ